MNRYSLMVKETLGRDESSVERRLTMMMFSVVLFFIGTNTIYQASKIMYWNHIIGTKTMMILRPIHTLLLTINSSVNIFFYLYFNKKFRRNFFKMFGYERPKKDFERNLSNEPGTRMTLLSRSLSSK